MKEGVTRIWPCRAAAIAGRADPNHSRNDHPAKAAFVVVSDFGSEMGAATRWQARSDADKHSDRVRANASDVVELCRPADLPS